MYDLHVAVLAVMAIMSIGLWTAMPESTAALTCALRAPRHSAASAHAVVTSAAAEESTLPISWSHVPGPPSGNGELHGVAVALLIPAMAAASCVSESAACSSAVWSRLSSLFFSFRDRINLVNDLLLSHVFRLLKSIYKCTTSFHQHRWCQLDLGFFAIVGTFLEVLIKLSILYICGFSQ